MSINAQASNRRPPIGFRLTAVLACLAAMLVPSMSPVHGATCDDPSGIGPYPAVASSQLNTTTWSAQNVQDGNATTAWSSVAHASQPAAETEWIAFWFGSVPTMRDVNYIKLRPRWVSGAPITFPAGFKLYYSPPPGNAWVEVPNTNFLNFPAPKADEWLVLPLPQTITTSGFLIKATTMTAYAGTYFFQLAEVGAGCSSGFGSAPGQWQYLGNDGTSTGSVDVDNTGSGAFNPARLTNWNLDIRGARIISQQPSGDHNIYAPSVVWDANSSPARWNIYFSGWDGSSDHHDRIYRATSTDDFTTFDPPNTTTRPVMVDHGDYQHAGNPSVVKSGSTSWRMAYTNGFSTGKTGLSTSTNGTTWSPNAARTSSQLQMSNFTGWSTADLNATNVLLKDGSTWHFYFNDIQTTNGGNNYYCTGVLYRPCKTFHATSTNGVNFTYVGEINAENHQVNDMESFSYGGSTYYLLGSAFDGTSSSESFKRLWMSSSTNPSSGFSTSAAFLTRPDGLLMTNMGWVAKDNRLYGALYGGTVDPVYLSNGAIYAAWLQKKVTFLSDNGARSYVSNYGEGPGTVWHYLDGNGPNETIMGKFTVKDSDGSTVLYTSPSVTLRAGDRWKYNP